MAWLTTMMWYQQAVTAFFLGFLPLVLLILLLGKPWKDPDGKKLDYSWMDFFGLIRHSRQRRKNHRETWEKAAVFNWCKCRVCVEYYEWKDSKMNSVGGGGGGAWGTPGGNPFSGSFIVRCATCKQGITGGLCSTCGPYAAIEYVASSGSGSSSVNFASASGVGGGGGGGSSNAVNRSTCAVCGARIAGGITCPGACNRVLAPGILCRNCAVPIPSGTCCSLACLAIYMPALYIPTGGGCLDCGSGPAPTYHAGCTQAGRLTQYLPTPGPYGSAGSPAPPAPPKKPIPVNGMQGYSERGTPDDWDMAIGTIRGYRWFKIEIPESWAGKRRREIRQGYFDATGKPEVHDEGPRELSAIELPTLIGAYGGRWEDGVNEAKCRRSMSTRPGNGFTHEPPEIREACGCGFWAYFDENIQCSQVLSQWQQAQDGWTGMAILGCVEGSGRVIVGEKGFRSQFAQITALTIGQVAVPQLMYWDTGQGGYGMGPGGSYGTPKVQCSDDELYARLAKIEDMLSRRYPNARIMSSEATLRGIFPPDKNYGSQ